MTGCAAELAARARGVYRRGGRGGVNTLNPVSMESGAVQKVFAQESERVMTSAYGFDIAQGGQGAIFSLSGRGRRDRRQTFGPWEAELRKDSAYICARSPSFNLNKPLADVIDAAHGVAQDLLDTVAVEERNALLVFEPHDNVVWRTGPHGLKLQLTSSITFTANMDGITAVVKNAAGEVLPDPPYMPPQHHFAYRYFRYSQAAESVLDSYRNMFLALESLLDYVDAKQAKEAETDWLKRALGKAQARGLNLGAFAKPGSTDPVDDFLDAHYSAVRCAAFHSKSSSGRTLRPGSLDDYGVVLQQLLAVQGLVEAFLKSEFSVRLPSSGFFHSGFGHLLSSLAPVTDLFISVGDCPTIEEVLAAGTGEDNLPEGGFSPVTFAGQNGAATDEWLFVSEIKPPDLPFVKVASLRLVARPNNHMFLGVIADKMNRTLINTDLDLADVSKLVVRVRCVLRNRQSPKRGFSH
jgi:hypothetical protein